MRRPWANGRAASPTMPAATACSSACTAALRASYLDWCSCCPAGVPAAAGLAAAGAAAAVLNRPASGSDRLRSRDSRPAPGTDMAVGPARQARGEGESGRWRLGRWGRLGRQGSAHAAADQGVKELPGPRGGPPAPELPVTLRAGPGTTCLPIQGDSQQHLGLRWCSLAAGRAASCNTHSWQEGRAAHSSPPLIASSGPRPHLAVIGREAPICCGPARASARYGRPRGAHRAARAAQRECSPRLICPGEAGGARSPRSRRCGCRRLPHTPRGGGVR